MKLIARHLNLIGLLLLTSFAATAAALYFQVPDRIQSMHARAKPAAARYACPMHPEVTSAPPADCPKCGMELVARAGGKPEPHGSEQTGCCNKKTPAPGPSAAMACPHLAAQAVQASACCPEPANP